MRAGLLQRLLRLEQGQKAERVLIFVTDDTRPDSDLTGFEIDGLVLNRHPKESTEALMGRIRETTTGGADDSPGDVWADFD